MKQVKMGLTPHPSLRRWIGLQELGRDKATEAIANTSPNKSRLVFQAAFMKSMLAQSPLVMKATTRGTFSHHYYFYERGGKMTLSIT